MCVYGHTHAHKHTHTQGDNFAMETTKTRLV